jgi:hypothetical protein
MTHAITLGWIAPWRLHFYITAFQGADHEPETGVPQDKPDRVTT